MARSEDGDRNADTGHSPDTLPDQEHARPRKRTRRACDKCSTSRTRCDGECPCRRCQDYGYACRYNRTVKKRGRIPASESIGSRPELWNLSTDCRNVAASRTLTVATSPKTIPEIASMTLHESPGDHLVPLAGAEPKFGNNPRDVSTSDSSALRSRTLPRISAVMTGPTVPSLAQVGIHPPSRLISPSATPRAPQPRKGSCSIPGVLDGHPVDSEVVISDESADYLSSSNGAGPLELLECRRSRGSFRSVTSNIRNRESISTSATAPPDAFPSEAPQKAPSEDCCYKFLDPVLPFIQNIIPVSVACELVDIFLTDPGSSLFRGASPYILTRVFRKKSIIHPSNPRCTTPALLATILWCVAQTADVMLLHVPGTRAKVVNNLYGLATSLMSERDPDRWRRIHGGLRAEKEVSCPSLPSPSSMPITTTANEPAGAIDDVLTFILLSIAVSGSDFKSDCYKWWSKAIRLALSLGLNREDERCAAPVSPCANPLCSCHRVDDGETSLIDLERREERRRVFWLLYSLDRHLSLSFNTALSMPDSYCEVYAPLPEATWENLDMFMPGKIPVRISGPPMLASGTGFFEYFLPLMAILGDIIEVHHRRRHPRLGEQEDAHSVAVVQELLTTFELSLNALVRDNEAGSQTPLSVPIHSSRDTAMEITTPSLSQTAAPVAAYEPADQSKIRLVKAYSTHILHVLHVLLHGKWDAISMLDDGDDWITSKHFTECASHAISASQSVSTILSIDPELTFMSYLFGIYLLQGSFILLLFADRMPLLGANESVEQACENIIRAHEVCVVTLNTEFQKNFRKVVRSTLYSVRGSGTTNWDEHRARRRALSLYRWTKGAKGLAL